MIVRKMFSVLMNLIVFLNDIAKSLFQEFTLLNLVYFNNSLFDLNVDSLSWISRNSVMVAEKSKNVAPAICNSIVTMEEELPWKKSSHEREKGRRRRN